MAWFQLLNKYSYIKRMEGSREVEDADYYSLVKNSFKDY